MSLIESAHRRGVLRLLFAMIKPSRRRWRGPRGSSCIRRSEFRPVEGEHHTAILSRCEKNQSIVERLALLLAAVSLEPCQEAGEDAGFAPCIPIGDEDAIRRPATRWTRRLGDDGCLYPDVSDRADRRAPPTRFGHRRVPETPGAQSNLRIVGEFSLQGVDINGGIEEQFRKRRPEVRQILQLGTITADEPCSIFLRLETAERLLERAARTQGRDLYSG